MPKSTQDISKSITNIHRDYIEPLAKSSGFKSKAKTKNYGVESDEHVLLIVGNQEETGLQLWNSLEKNGEFSIDRSRTDVVDTTYDQENFMVFSSINAQDYRKKVNQILKGQHFRISPIDSLKNYTIIIAPNHDQVNLDDVLQYCKTLVFGVSANKRMQIQERYRNLLLRAQNLQKLVYVAMTDCAELDLTLLLKKRDILGSELKGCLRDIPDMFYAGDAGFRGILVLNLKIKTVDGLYYFVGRGKNVNFLRL